MKYFDINAAVGHWPFQKVPDENASDLKILLNRYDVAKVAVVNTHGLFYRDVQNANQELYEWIAEDDFFVGVASINPDYPRWDYDLKKCIKSFGFKALRLTPFYHGYSLTARNFDRALDLAAEMDIPVLIPHRIMDVRQKHHLDVGTVLFAEDYFAIADRHKNCKIICTEMMFTHEDLPGLVARPNLYVELSRQFVGFTGLLSHIVNTIGAERVLFASGAPFKEPLSAVLKLNHSGLDEDSIQKIAFDNALKLLK